MSRGPLKALLREPPDDEAIGQWLDRQQVPIVDPGGATFLFHGAADAVNLRHWIFGLPSSQPLEQVPGTRLWHAHLELPPGSRIEYKLEVVSDGTSAWLTDPRNPALAHDPFGANSVCAAYGYERPAWSLPDPDARPGSLDELTIESAVFGDTRRLQLYLPARFRRSRRYPLLVVHDGSDFLRFADLQTVLDNLIHANEVAPMIVLMSDPVDRLAEYRGSTAHSAFVAEELLPRAEQEFPLIEAPAARGLLGASLGAVASLSTAWRYPGVFDNLLLQSGSFAFSDIGKHRRDPVFDPVVELINAFRADPGRPAARVYQTCGIYESLIYENRSMVPLLQALGIEVRYEEARDGHHWENWRDRLRAGLSFLFPGPLWFVYE
ncbi:MAG: alpha/beta hydrolase-fold protein [Geminicoccaceae bacterium]|nr:alpha/beta hydrolase-fold protein [Geminicoccaceae bacterium]